jgi:hypothetical protein
MKFTIHISTFLLVLFVSGCDEPDTIVTNIVHYDGSVTRRVEIRNDEDSFEPESFKVPLDTSWIISRTIEVSSDGDTAWVFIAEKLFPDVFQLNAEYGKGIGVNSAATRSASFERGFRWFTTCYRFSETVGKIIQGGFPLKDFLSTEELEFITLPESVSDELLAGADSIRYANLSDKVDSITDIWLNQSLISSWFLASENLLRDAGADSAIVNGFLRKENRILQYFGSVFDQDLDDIILKEFSTEVGAGYEYLLDSAITILEEKLGLFIELKEYTLMTTMPGKLTGGNGYITPGREVAWAVRPELYLFEDYLMWAESQKSNRWAWYVSGAFVILVVAGFLKKNTGLGGGRYRKK